MEWASVIGIAAAVAAMFWYEWPRIGADMKREKFVFAALAVTGGVLAAVLVFNPGLPGPTLWIQALYESLLKEAYK